MMQSAPHEAPLLFIVAGANGSGKSTLAGQLDFSKSPLINPDEIARGLNPNSPESVAIQAGRKTLEMIEDAFKKRESFAIETTLSGNHELKLIERARSLGYIIKLAYIGVDDPRVNIGRVHQRVASGGHNVPSEDIIRRYARSMAHLLRAIALADETRIYDNSGTSQQLIMEYQHGQVMFLVQNVPAWAQKALAPILNL